MTSLLLLHIVHCCYVSTPLLCFDAAMCHKQSVLDRERRGDYLGKTVQVVPHITDAIQDWIQRVAHIPVDGRDGVPGGHSSRSSSSSQASCLLLWFLLLGLKVS
jgi:hypothetical protein